MLVIQFDYLTCFSNTHTKHRPATRQYVNFTSKLARAIDNYKGFLSSEGTHNFKFTCNHNKERDIDVSLLDQQFATLNRTYITMSLNTINLGWC